MSASVLDLAVTTFVGIALWLAVWAILMAVILERFHREVRKVELYWTEWEDMT